MIHAYPPQHTLCHVLTTAIVGGLVASADAHAGCPSTPVNWAAHDCEVDSVPVCVASGVTWECEVSSSSSEAEVTTIMELPTLYSFGTHDGELFCCASPDNFGAEIVITRGSAHDDLLSFLFAAASQELRELSGSAMTATIYGGAGADTILGSNRDSSKYRETLRGQDDPDNIQANDGDDYLYGGLAGDVCDGGPGDDFIYGEEGGDTLEGNAGKDTIEGGPGNDTIRGGDGDDELYGGAGDDRVGGGVDNDVIDGGTGGDVMCGDGESGGYGDAIHDGPTSGTVTPKNIIWGANSLDILYCTAANTETDMVSPYTGPCNQVLTTKPGQCP